MTTFHDSRLGPGTLTLGTTPEEFGVQVSAITLTPSTNSQDGTPTLAVPDPAPELTTTYTLDGSAIDDHQNPGGLSRYAYDNDGETVAFVWTPNTDEPTPTILTGEVVMSAFPIGGNVGEQLVNDFSWPCVGKPAFTGGAAAMSAGRAKAASK
jgi:hypothetical protein